MRCLGAQIKGDEDMKHGTTPTLAIKLALTPEELQSVSFAFRPAICEAVPNLIAKSWPDDDTVSYEDTQERWLIALSPEETWRFAAGTKVFMDVRPVLANGCVPDAAIVCLGLATPSFFPGSKTDTESVAGDPDAAVEVALEEIYYDGGPRSITGSQGSAGGYYTPSVDEDGNLTWTASEEDMPAVAGTNIKGPKGDTGAAGIAGPAGPAGVSGKDGATPVRGVDYWTEEDQTAIVDAVLAALPDGDEVSY